MKTLTILISCFAMGVSAQNDCQYKLYFKNSPPAEVSQHHPELICQDADGRFAINIRKLEKWQPERAQKFYRDYAQHWDIVPSHPMILSIREIDKADVEKLDYRALDMSKLKEFIVRNDKPGQTFSNLDYFIVVDVVGNEPTFAVAKDFQVDTNLLTFPFYSAMSSLNKTVFVGKDKKSQTIIYRAGSGLTADYYNFSQNPTVPLDDARENHGRKK